MWILLVAAFSFAAWAASGYLSCNTSRFAFFEPYVKYILFLEIVLLLLWLRNQHWPKKVKKKRRKKKKKT